MIAHEAGAPRSVRVPAAPCTLSVGAERAKGRPLYPKEPALLDTAAYSAKILPGFMIPFGSNTALTAFM